MTEFFVSMRLQDTVTENTVTENNWSGGTSLKIYKIILKTNSREMKTK